MAPRLHPSRPVAAIAAVGGFVALTVGVPKETYPGERRVAITPRAFDVLAKSGVQWIVERGAGEEAGFPDAAFEARGARIGSRSDVFREARLILQVRALGANPQAGRADLELLTPEHTVIGFMEPLTAAKECAGLAARGVTSLSMELMPRITRAQPMDALSSMATIAGYKAVLLAANELPRLFPMLMTAAGTIPSARVFVLGAGVAGLQAIATARRLGAVVSAYDVRSAVKEQIQSLGGKFVEINVASEAMGSEGKGGYAKAMSEEFYRLQRARLLDVVKESDAVICTAAVPGKKAPILVNSDMVRAMEPGSVIVDLAAERGGNCELTRPGETVTDHGVRILGPLNVPSAVPNNASQMYARNLATFVKLLVRDGVLNLNLDDEIVRETLVTHEGSVVHPLVREAISAAALQPAEELIHQ